MMRCSSDQSMASWIAFRLASTPNGGIVPSASGGAAFLLSTSIRNTFGLNIASGQRALVLRGAADMHVGMSELFRERNRLDAALQQHLSDLKKATVKELVNSRYTKFRNMAQFLQVEE